MYECVNKATFFLTQVVVLIFAIRRQYGETANHSTLALYLIACQCLVSCNVDFIVCKCLPCFDLSNNYSMAFCEAIMLN